MHMNTEQLKKWKAHQENMTQNKSSSEIIISLVCVDILVGNIIRIKERYIFHFLWYVFTPVGLWSLGPKYVANMNQRLPHKERSDLQGDAPSQWSRKQTNKQTHTKGNMPVTTMTRENKAVAEVKPPALKNKQNFQ